MEDMVTPHRMTLKGLLRVRDALKLIVDVHNEEGITDGIWSVLHDQAQREIHNRVEAANAKTDTVSNAPTNKRKRTKRKDRV